MIRTEWLNMSVARLRAVFAVRCGCSLARSLSDIRDTAAEAVERKHRTRAEVLHRAARRAEIGCVGPVLKVEHRKGA